MAVDLQEAAEAMFRKTGRYPSALELMMLTEAIASVAIEHPEEP